jgi:hypothetical protein
MVGTSLQVTQVTPLKFLLCPYRIPTIPPSLVVKSLSFMVNGHIIIQFILLNPDNITMLTPNQAKDWLNFFFEGEQLFLNG